MNDKLKTVEKIGSIVINNYDAFKQIPKIFGSIGKRKKPVPASSPCLDTAETAQVQPGPLHISNPEDVEPEDDNYDAEASFRKDLESLINHYSREYPSNTPDFILAEYLCGCLELFDKTMQDREKWYGDSVDNQVQNLR